MVSKSFSSHAQLKILHVAMKDPTSATKTWSSQINTLKNKEIRHKPGPATGNRYARNSLMTTKAMKTAKSRVQLVLQPLRGVDLSPKQDEGVLKFIKQEGPGTEMPVIGD